MKKKYTPASPPTRKLATEIIILVPTNGKILFRYCPSTHPKRKKNKDEVSSVGILH